MAMVVNISGCPIWGRDFHAEGHEFIGVGDQGVNKSDRAGGSYFITAGAIRRVEQLTPQQKARLTTWLVNQREQGVNRPDVTEDIVAYAVDSRPLQIYERALRLLRFLTDKTRIVSDIVELTVKFSNKFPAANRPSFPGSDRGTYNGLHLQAMARTESTEHSEVFYLAYYLETEGLITNDSDGNIFQVTVAGYRRIEDLKTRVDSSQAFVAMWFDPEMNKVYEEGIEPGIEDAGYRALRIDRKEHSNKIDDEIIAEIRRSRFLVADFTQGPDGARGGVYYEAGFAEGLRIPVIHTCRKDALEKLAFDTRQYKHIVWETVDELRIALRNRIRAVIEGGPEIDSENL